MMHHGLFKLIGWISWIITALASIHIGLMGAFGWNVMGQSWFPAAFVMPAYYIILAAGIYSLVLFVMMTTCGCGHCGTKNCSCK